ncbi:MAG: transcriptional repressor [Paludibacter sp.]|nr:transcriptional repressor [Bacteroidales bacterium]MCM1068466.1 transcriptional repressor [Prevotella sp.]MCM1353420.1 transcriptional repressor [Bacteroides sp.]MCM1442581.1 transcriptional repressor [Muribaculum sp.]MCM1481426.1 transcriptional repressor [Paludibacter sp.]
MINNTSIDFNARDYLQTHGISPSLARIAIAEDLHRHRQHATAEAIYERISKQNLNLSRATVYNTLNLFAEKGAIRSINIDGKYTRYDFVTDFHAHFRCRICGAIEDIAIANRPLFSNMPAATIETEEYYISGICPRCKQNIIKQ